MTARWLALLAVACGRIGFDELASDAARGSDAASGSARDCTAMWMAGTIEFGPPTLLASVSTPALERDPFLSPDERTIYFSRGDTTTGDIYTATRPDLGDDFTAPVTFDAVNSALYESKMSISLDGLTLSVCRGPGGSMVGDQVLLASRASQADPWSAPTATYATEIDAMYTVFDAELGNDGTTMYLAPALAGQPQTLAIAARTSSTDFVLGQLAGYVPDSATYRDADPWADPSGNLIVFSRDPIAGDDVDIVYMTADSTGSFGPVLPVPGVNSTGSDGDPWLAPGGCRMYFSSTRDGDYNLYVASVP